MPAAPFPPESKRPPPVPGRAGAFSPLALLRRLHEEERRRERPPTRRIESIQVCRGIAAWMVVFHHWMQLGGGSVSGLGMGRPFVHYGAFGVDLFFVISGLVMRHSVVPGRAAAPSFAVNRIVRIVPAYWFYTLLLVAVAGLSGKFGFTRWTPVSLAQSLLFIPHENPSGVLGWYPFLTVGWSLNFEMFFYLVLLGCLVVVPARAFLVCGGLLGALPFLWPAGWPDWGMLRQTRLTEFALGILLGHLSAAGWLGRLRPAPVWAAACLLAGGLALRHHTDLSLLAAAFLLLAAACLAEGVVTRLPGVRFLAYLGTISYSTYLCHLLVLGLVLDPARAPWPWRTEAGMLAGTVLAIGVVSALSHRWLEAGTGAWLQGRWRAWMRAGAEGEGR